MMATRTARELDASACLCCHRAGTGEGLEVGDCLIQWENFKPLGLPCFILMKQFELVIPWWLNNRGEQLVGTQHAGLGALVMAFLLYLTRTSE